MTKQLSPETIAIVKSTAPVLQQHGMAITTRMYERLFEDPEIAALFAAAGSDRGEQPKRLAAAILAYAQNVDNLGALSGGVDAITRRHIATHVQPEHYAPVAQALLPAIKDVLGDAIDATVLGAWGEAYWFLAEIMIAREDALRAEAATNAS
jgi:hemoglobin-like flavoprotein